MRKMGEMEKYPALRLKSKQMRKGTVYRTSTLLVMVYLLTLSVFIRAMEDEED